MIASDGQIWGKEIKVMGGRNTGERVAQGRDGGKRCCTDTGKWVEMRPDAARRDKMHKASGVKKPGESQPRPRM